MLTKTLGTRQRLPSTPAESLLRAEAIIADRRGPAPCSDSKAQGLCFQIQNPAELQRLAGLPHKSAILVMIKTASTQNSSTVSCLKKKTTPNSHLHFKF
jgi:hypothetical protein